MQYKRRIQKYKYRLHLSDDTKVINPIRDSPFLEYTLLHLRNTYDGMQRFA